MIPSMLTLRHAALALAAAANAKHGPVLAAWNLQEVS